MVCWRRPGGGNQQDPQVPTPRPPPSFPPSDVCLCEENKTTKHQATTVPAALILSRGERIPGGEGQLEVALGSTNVERTPERSALTDRDDRTNYFRARCCGGKPTAGRSSPR
jgi:hypothetical protein